MVLFWPSHWTRLPLAPQGCATCPKAIGRCALGCGPSTPVQGQWLCRLFTSAEPGTQGKFSTVWCESHLAARRLSFLFSGAQQPGMYGYWRLVCSLLQRQGYSLAPKIATQQAKYRLLCLAAHALLSRDWAGSQETNCELLVPSESAAHCHYERHAYRVHHLKDACR